MGFKLKTVFRADVVLELFDGIIAELNHFPARDTDQMIVMLMAHSRFVMGMILTELDLSDQTALDQQGQCTIDCGSRELFPLQPELCGEIIRLKVVVHCKHLSQYQFPLDSEFQTLRA